MDGCKVLDGVQADPQDGVLGDEVAPNMHVSGSQPVSAGPGGVQPQSLLQISHWPMLGPKLWQSKSALACHLPFET